MAETKDLVDQFLQAGVAAEQARQLTEKRRRTRTIAVLAIGLAVVAALAVVASLFAAQTNRQASDLEAAATTDAHRLIDLSTSQAQAVQERDNRATAQSGAAAEANERATAEADAIDAMARAQSLAKTATSRELAAAAVSMLGTDPVLSILLAEEAVQAEDTFEAEDALHRALQASHWRATLRGHVGNVSSTVFSPDGALVATAGEDGTVRLWKVPSGEKRMIFYGHDGKVNRVSFDHDGRLMVTSGEDGTVRLWNVTTGEPEAILRGHEGMVYLASFTPDGRFVVSAGADGTARLWSTEMGREIGQLGHDGEVRSAAFSFDGRLVVTAASDDTARIWEVEEARELVVIRDPGISSAEFSPDGQLVLTVSIVVTRTESGGIRPDTTARLWETETGREVAVLSEGGARMPMASFSPDGRFVATTGWGEGAATQVWEVATAKHIADLHGHEKLVRSATFSPDSRLLATTSTDGTARLWEVSTAREMVVLRGLGDWLDAATFSPDGRLLVTTGGYYVHQDEAAEAAVQIWEVETGTEVAVLRGDEGRIHTISFCPDERLLVAAYADSAVRLWNVETGEVTRLTARECGVLSAASSPDGQFVAAVSGECPFGSSTGEDVVQLWEAESGAETGVLCGHSLSFSPDGRFVVTVCGDNEVLIWDMQKGKQVGRLIGRKTQVLSADFSGGGESVVTISRTEPSSEDVAVQLWEAGTWREIAVLEGRTAHFSPHGRSIIVTRTEGAKLWNAETAEEIATLGGNRISVQQVAFSPHGNLLATAGNDRLVHLWYAESGQGLAVMSGPTIWVDAMVISPDGKRIAVVWSGPRISGGSMVEFEMLLYDIETGREIAVLYEHESGWPSAGFSSDGELLVTTSADKEPRLWDADSGQQIAFLHGHEGEVDAASISPNGRLIATVGQDNVVRIHAVSLEHLMTLAEARTPRELACQERVRYLHEGLDCRQ